MKNKNFHKNGMEVIKEGNGSYKKRPNEKNKSEKYYNNNEILTGSMALRDDRG